VPSINAIEWINEGVFSQAIPLRRSERWIAMKSVATLAMTLLVTQIVTRPAWAIETAGTYQSSMLVLLFLGVCALIIVAQMVPALIMMMGTISGLAKRIAARKQVAVVNVNQNETK
jgi:hypothetical protein